MTWRIRLRNLRNATLCDGLRHPPCAVLNGLCSPCLTFPRKEAHERHRCLKSLPSGLSSSLFSPARAFIHPFELVYLVAHAVVISAPRPALEAVVDTCSIFFERWKN